MNERDEDMLYTKSGVQNLTVEEATNGLKVVNMETGEVVKATAAALFPGDTISTAAERNKKREQWKNMASEVAEAKCLKKELQDKQDSILGKYVFIDSNENAFPELSSSTLVRAAYLATYLRYETNDIYRTQRAPLKLSDLPKLMNLSEKTIRRFWKEVDGKYFYQDENGTLHTKGNAFIFGSLNADVNDEYQKLRVQAFRELYKKIPVRQHSRLGYVLKVLPYVNFEYNVLCHNTEERNHDLVDAVTVSEFCDLIGYDKDNVRHLAREYGNITFTVNGYQELFCLFLIKGGDDIGNGHVYINPRLIYKGTDFRKVAAVGISFNNRAKPE